MEFNSKISYIMVLHDYHLQRSPGIIRKSRVWYPGPGFLSSATWHMLPKKHYNGLNQTKPVVSNFYGGGGGGG